MVIRLLARVFASWETSSILRVGGFLGAIWFHLIRVRRGVAEHAVARAFPEKSPAEVRAIVKRNFQHLMTSLLESLAYVAYPEARLRSLIKIEGVEAAVSEPRAKGRGIVAISAHIGNFEMCTDACGLLYDFPMIIVARLPKGGFARAMLDAFRMRNSRMEVFEPKGSGPKVLECFRTKQSVLAFVIDQNLRRGRGVFVPFLGELANTTTGFASLLRKSGAAFCVVQMYRENDGTHRLRVTPVPPSDHPNMRVGMLNDTLTMSNHIQSFVREHPEQWFWVHRRWKARPETGDLVRTDAGLERFGQGRVTAALINATPAALSSPQTTEAIRRLRDAGVAIVHDAQGLDASSALIADSSAPDLLEQADRFLEKVVSLQEAVER